MAKSLYKGTFVLILLFFMLLAGCAQRQEQFVKPDNKPIQEQGTGHSVKSLAERKKEIIAKYQDRQPKQWGQRVTGVKTRLDTKEKVVALTFDACGGGGPSSGYNARLINFLAGQSIPATLFINSRWIDANPEIFKQLANNRLFEIENHGFKHKPLSVNGKAIYGIKGTGSIDEIVDEVELNAQKIKELTGRKPRYFRSGTAYYDDVAVSIVQELGYEAVNFDIIGDAGATYSKERVKKACLSAKPGSLLIFHMNHPESATAEGVMEVVHELKKRGFKFVKLEEQQLQ